MARPKKTPEQKAEEEKYGTALTATEEHEPEEPQGNGNGNGHKKPVVRPKKPEVVEIDNKALRDMLLRLASKEFDNLKQLTDLPLKLTDPIAKGIAYYDATLEILQEQFGELLDWYIERCELDIKNCTMLIAEKVKDEKELPPVDQRGKLNFFDKALDKVLGKPKPKITPALELLDLNDRLKVLNKRLVELQEDKNNLETYDTEEMFFKKWAFNLCLVRRSLGGHGHDSLVSLADAQIVTQQEQGMDKFGGIFTR